MSMTTNEINEIIGMTKEDLKQKRKELACLNSKARKMAEGLENVGKVLRGKVIGNCSNGFFFMDIPGEKRFDWPTIQDMNDILQTRQNLEEKIIELEKDCKEMGH